MTIDEMNLRGVPGQEEMCLWLKKEGTETFDDLHTRERVSIRYQRRCRLPQGHEGMHLLASFPMDEKRQPWEAVLSGVR